MRASPATCCVASPKDQPLRIAVAHANRPESGQRLHDLLTAGVPDLVSSYVTDLGAVISAHAGPGALVASAIPALPLPPAGQPTEQAAGIWKNREDTPDFDAVRAGWDRG